MSAIAVWLRMEMDNVLLVVLEAVVVAAAVVPVVLVVVEVAVAVLEAQEEAQVVELGAVAQVEELAEAVVVREAVQVVEMAAVLIRVAEMFVPHYQYHQTQHRAQERLYQKQMALQSNTPLLPPVQMCPVRQNATMAMVLGQMAHVNAKRRIRLPPQ